VLDRTTPHEDPTAWRQALLILAAAALLRLALAAVVPLFPDEAYYWEWSRRLAGGYFDHPPGIAWLVRAGTALLGPSPFAVRLAPILVASSGGLAIALAARTLAGDRAARYAALDLLGDAARGGGARDRDAGCAAPRGAGVDALRRGARARCGAAGAPPRRAGGSSPGSRSACAMSSKFTGVFAPIALLIAFAVEPSLRARFREPGPWLAVLLASAVMIPVLWWNASHDWIAFRFQLGHGLGGNARENLFQRELNLVGSQFLLVTPILFVLVIGAIRRNLRAPRHEARFALATISAFCVLFFVYSATRRNQEANWPAIAWIPALILVAAARDGARSVWERRAAWLAGGLSAILVLHAVFRIIPLPARRDQVSLAHGWDRLALAVDSARLSLAGTDGSTPPVAANRYQDAALLSYHMPARPYVTALNLGGRRNQYDLWTATPISRRRAPTCCSCSRCRARGSPARSAA
jgi:4-amino-4-deoxy-L-arabinose transferase-like glycosyltransferase